MALMHDEPQIRALWADWQSKTALRPGVPTVAVLRDILDAQGTVLSLQDLSFALGGPDHHATLDTTRFTDCMVALLGDPALRVRHAFAAFAVDADGKTAKADLLSVINAFTDDTDAATLLADEIDADGDGYLTLDDITHYLGDAPHVASTYRATHLAAHHVGTGPVNATPSASLARTQDSDAGISSLQMRIGFFRLVQGAAYRSFRANYAANSETHLRARDLPYTIDDFARFTSVTIDYYLSLGIITDPACIAEFQRLDTLVQDEVARLHSRIATWPTVDKTPAMLAAQTDIAIERDGLTQRRGLCHAVMEFILSLRLHGIGIADAGTDALARYEINRLRHADLRAETNRTPRPDQPASADFLDTWNRVILSETDDSIDGAIMPTRFWYDSFMPQLLLCASLTDAGDLKQAQETTESDLDAWHAAETAAGRFDHFATDLRDCFADCSHEIKLALRQAWALTAPYLAGVEKRREREEFGRDSGYLSEYVAFIDTHLGRDDIAASEMRVSFPYYIGPAVWGLLHGSAELVEAMPVSERLLAINRFTAFFRSFATMYPCPYCRYHLNRYVIRNREIDMYPIEFLLLGLDQGQHDMVITLDAKLATIAAPGGLRLFLWKLHNAVSSSIARTEPWYHQEPKPLYTTRFWPGIEAELARAAARGHKVIEIDRMAQIYRVTKPAARLAVLRDELGLAVRAADAAGVIHAVDQAQNAISDLTLAMNDTAYLTRKYAYNPDYQDDALPVDKTQEDFARSALFVER